MSGTSSTPILRESFATFSRVLRARLLRSAMTRAIDLTSHDYAGGIAQALRDDYAGDSMVKRIAEDTGAAIGTVKKWLAEENGPGGEHLIKLMAASPAVRAFVDAVTHRDDLARQAEERMRRALRIMEGHEDP